MVRAPAAVRPGGVEVRLGEERGQADQAQSEGLRSNRHAEAEAADALLPLKKKLRALSYGTGGQDPRHLFGQYDRDNSGELCAPVPPSHDHHSHLDLGIATPTQSLADLNPLLTRP